MFELLRSFVFRNCDSCELGQLGLAKLVEDVSYLFQLGFILADVKLEGTRHDTAIIEVQYSDLCTFLLSLTTAIVSHNYINYITLNTVKDCDIYISRSRRVSLLEMGNEDEVVEGMLVCWN